MGRTARDNRDLPHPKPVQKIELPEGRTWQRLLAVVLLLALGCAALGYSLRKLLEPETGWQAIEAGTGGMTCGDEFVFLYDLGAGDTGVRAENEAVTALYTQSCRKAYQLFSTVERFEGVVSLRELNLRPNETLTVDEALYRAFEAVARAGDRTLYLGPICARYGDLFYCGDDSQLVDFDPRLSEDVRAEYEALAAFTRDPGAVDLRLLGEGRVSLYVSAEYLAYARENGVTDFIDFGWMKNAFIADYLAQTMIEGGFTHGSISSYDGFSRNLDGRGMTYALNLYDRLDGRVIQCGTLEYQGPMSLASLRGFPVNAEDEGRFYRLESGEVRTMYLDPADGLCRNAPDSLVCCSGAHGCGELALAMAPAFIADELREDRLDGLADRGIRYVCCVDRTLYVSGPELTLTDLYRSGDAEYTVSPRDK